MEIREITEEDIPQCVEIYNYYIENTTITLEEERLTEEEFSSRVRKIRKNYPYLVIKEGQQVYGYAYLDAFNARSAYSISADLSIYIRKDKCHLGLGLRLFDEIIVKAKEAKIENIISLVTKKNEPSKKFHVKNGFILEGELHDVARKFNCLQSVCFYRKKI